VGRFDFPLGLLFSHLAGGRFPPFGPYMLCSSAGHEGLIFPCVLLLFFPFPFGPLLFIVQAAPLRRTERYCFLAVGSQTKHSPNPVFCYNSLERPSITQGFLFWIFFSWLATRFSSEILLGWKSASHGAMRIMLLPHRSRPLSRIHRAVLSGLSARANPSTKPQKQSPVETGERSPARTPLLLIFA